MTEKTDVFYLAPMIGITDSAFRNAFQKYFGGFDVAVSPFVRTLQGQRYKKSHLKDLKQSLNQSVNLIPQVLTNQVEDMVYVSKVLFDMGYAHINLNMGCPVPSASGKGRGAALLCEFDYMDRFFEDVLKQIPNKLSVKTRIGYESENDLIKMSNVLNRYPLTEIIVHPRTAKQKYGGVVNLEKFKEFINQTHHKTVYSGDICSVLQFQEFKKQLPNINRWMIGRGILKNPWLFCEIRNFKNKIHNNLVYGDFVRTVAGLLIEKHFDEQSILKRIKPIINYYVEAQSDDKKIRKSLKKSRSLEDVYDLLQHQKL